MIGFVIFKHWKYLNNYDHFDISIAFNHHLKKIYTLLNVKKEIIKFKFLSLIFLCEIFDSSDLFNRIQKTLFNHWSSKRNACFFF